MCTDVTKPQGELIPTEIREGLMNDFWNVWQNVTTSEVYCCWHFKLRLMKKDRMHVECLKGRSHSMAGVKNVSLKI